MDQITHFLTWLEHLHSLQSPRIQLVWIVIAFMIVFIVIFIAITLVISSYNFYKKNQILKLKESLKPLIVAYLFDDEENHEIHLNSIENWIKEHSYSLISPKKLCKNVLIEYQQTVKGDSSRKLNDLYHQLHLERSYVKLFYLLSVNRKIEIIRELSLFKTLESEALFKQYVKSENPRIRMEAQIALVRLHHFEGLHFLDTEQHILPNWNQLILLEILTQENNDKVIEPVDWLQSKNESVVCFALKYIQLFYLTKYTKEIIALLQHSSEEVIIESVNTITNLELYEALPHLDPLLDSHNSSIKHKCINAFASLGNEEYISRLKSRFYNCDATTRTYLLDAILKIDPSYNLTYNIDNSLLFIS